ncbi:hypothetical protein GPALN_004833 [Globodera pallida]|nr:hypothetical protein GPALN_004833 [Globodera pallida]
MCWALRGKFGRPGPIQQALLGTGFLMIVEASGDRFWGAGLEMGDERIGATAQWRGENALGQALMAIREEVRPLPPQPSAASGRYIVCQAAAVDHVVVVAEDPAAQPYLVKVTDEVVGPGRKLQVGDSLEVEAVQWRAGFERLRLTAEGGADMPGWLFQGRLVAQAEATATTGVERGEWGEVDGQVASCVYGGARGRRAVCSARVRGEGGHLWSLTQRNFAKDLGSVRDEQWLKMRAVVVPQEWRVDWGWVLPSNTRLKEPFAWEGWKSDGECWLPVFVE